eukprot:SAG11_NODE_3683_length_2285_cov_4.703111_3_plen_150_part_00
MVISGRREAPLQEAVDQLRQLGGGMAKAGYAKGDVGIEVEAEAMVARAVEQFGSLDIVVNNAGIIDGYGPFEECAAAAFDKVIATNVRGTFLVSRAAVKQMKKQGSGGAIVHNSSVCGVVAWKNLCACEFSCDTFRLRRWHARSIIVTD